MKYKHINLIIISSLIAMLCHKKLTTSGAFYTYFCSSGFSMHNAHLVISNFNRTSAPTLYLMCNILKRFGDCNMGSVRLMVIYLAYYSKQGTHARGHQRPMACTITRPWTCYTFSLFSIHLIVFFLHSTRLD